MSRELRTRRSVLGLALCGLVAGAAGCGGGGGSTQEGMPSDVEAAGKAAAEEHLRMQKEMGNKMLEATKGGGTAKKKRGRSGVPD